MVKAAIKWSVEKLQGKTPSEIYLVPVTEEWTLGRKLLHEQVISRMLAGKRETPKLWIIMGGVGSGKSTMIRLELEPQHPGAVVIDADRMWQEIPEYDALAAADWRTVGDYTYAEARCLRDEALANDGPIAFSGEKEYLCHVGYRV